MDFLTQMSIVILRGNIQCDALETMILQLNPRAVDTVNVAVGADKGKSQLELVDE